MDRLVGERAGARNHADLARLVNVTWHYSDFAFARRYNARAVRADQSRTDAAQITLDSHHIEDRNAFGDTDYQLDAGRRGFKYRVCGECRRDINDAGIRSSRPARLLDGVKDRNSLKVRAALARHHPANHP